MSELTEKKPPRVGVVPPILLVMTGVTGIVDAVSYLALGHVFTANMTGNIVLLGFAFAGTPGLSVSRSLVALLCFLLGGVIGGRIPVAGAPRAFAAEALLLLAAAAIALRLIAPYEQLTSAAVYGVIASTGLAMGIRNAIVRKLAVPDLTTTVLTLTITALAADSVFAGGENPRWKRRSASVGALLAGAAAGALLLRRSASLTLGIASTATAVCALVAHCLTGKDKKS